MALEGQNECAVHECGRPCSAWANLCERHKVGGVVVEIGAGSVVVTHWYAEHNNQFCLILLNDWALGHLFGGDAGFKGRSKKQGFTNVRNLIALEEFDSAFVGAGKTAANWSGPWSTTYPWEPKAK